MTNQPINKSVDLLVYTLQIADNALILGHRISELCGHGPVLEQDIAITNTALDHLGSARSLYQYAAELFNNLPAGDKNNIFTSAPLQQNVNVGHALDEDDMAYLRDGWDFHNVLLAEQPNKDWAYIVARSFFMDVFNFYFYTELKASKDETLAAVAEKALKEVTYHMRWSSEWVIRLGDGTEESHARMQEAINKRWAFTGEMFQMTDADHAMVNEGIGVELSPLKTAWTKRITDVLAEATLTVPEQTWMQEGGKEGRHTEHLGFLLAELQFMQRAYPNMEW